MGFIEVNSTQNTSEILDNGGRRTGIDRRYYSYSGHIPERRCGFDRRKLDDRRQSAQKRQDLERRKAWAS